jgi:hypothetical protein
MVPKIMMKSTPGAPSRAYPHPQTLDEIIKAFQGQTLQLNGTVRVKKCKQLFEYQHFLLL